MFPNRVEVLQSIWKQSLGSVIFLPQMLPTGWVEGAAVDPFVEGLESVFSWRSFRADQYFTPLRYFDTKRRRDAVGFPGVIFADIDGGVINPKGMPPSVLIESSPDHFHGYWFLTEPASVEDWEPRAKGWTQMLGADPGGWDLTQVLRVPHTSNFKRAVPFRVTTVLYEPSRKYDLEQFPVATISPLTNTSVPTPDQAKRGSYLARAFAIGNLPLSVLYWISVTDQEVLALGKIDRSALLWKVIRSLYEAGFTPDEVFQIAYHTAINKHKGQPEKLWQTIEKAGSA